MRLILVGCFLALIATDSRLIFADDAGGSAGPTTAPAPQDTDDAAKNDDIRKLLQLSGVGRIGEQIVKQMLGSMERLLPNVPQKFWDDCAKEMNGDSMVELVIPIYAKHFSHDEIKQLIAFYESPIGKRLIAEQPAITQEAMQAGQAWGQQIGQRIAQKLKDAGYDKQN